MFSVRNLILKSISRVSQFLVYHRFMEKPFTYLEDELRKSILKEVDRIHSVLNKLVEKHPAMFSNGVFNQYGAFLMRDLIAKDLFNITMYEHSDLFQKVARNSIKSNSSPEILRVANTLKALFKDLSNDYCHEFNQTEYVKLFNDCVHLFLLKFFVADDTRNFADSLIYALAGVLVYEREEYGEVQTEDSRRAAILLDDYLFEVLNDSIGIYSYNVYEKLYRALPTRFSNRMVSLRQKQKLISESRYFFQQTRKPSDIYLFRRSS